MGFGLLNNTNKCKISNLKIEDLNIENNYETEYPNLKPKIYNGYIDPTSYYNTVILCDKKKIIDVDKSNKLLYYCNKCKKNHNFKKNID